MPLQDLRTYNSRSRASQIYSELRAAILQGKMLPGERLVEAAIANAYSVSRTPVREALHKLAVDRLTEEAGRGTVVRAVQLEEFEGMCSVRETLEGMAGRLAAQRRSDLDIRTMSQLIDDLRKIHKANDVPATSALSAQLHDVILRAGGNSYLGDLLSDLSSYINRVQGTTLERADRRESALEEHAAIVDAILKQDEGEAEALSWMHFHEISATRLARGLGQ